MLSREQRIFVGGGKGGSIRIHSAYALFRYSIPMLPEAAQFGGTPACQWFSGAEKCHAAAPAAKAVMKTSA